MSQTKEKERGRNKNPRSPNTTNPIDFSKLGLRNLGSVIVSPPNCELSDE